MDSILSRVLAEARTVQADWPVQEPEFRVRTGWSRSYDQVLEENFDSTHEGSDFFDKVLTNGRAILTGRGGDGKTSLLRRLFKQALSARKVPIFIDLTKWSGGDYAEWNEWTSDDLGDGMDFLLRRFSAPRAGAMELDLIPPDHPKIFFVDGLNEITLKVGNEILVVLDKLAREQLNTSVVVADRLIRRELPNQFRWWVGMTLPLSDQEIRRHLGSAEILAPDDIRRSPFFLDTHMKFGGRGSRAESLQRRLQEHAALSSSELDAAGAAAYEVYKTHRSRSFERQTFADVAGEKVVRELETSGAVTSKDGTSFFQHHMLHDYLAARYFASREKSSWTPENFRVISFDGSSFDAVELAFEQLQTSRIDSYLRSLYDWNLYGAGYALAQGRSDEAAMGCEMRTVILAMLAEKKFDAILATRERANDALHIMQQEDVAAFRSAESLADIQLALGSEGSDTHWFVEWKQLFGLSMEERMPMAILAKVTDVDSVVGWTVANVARRAQGNEWMIPMLTQWLRAENAPTIRWRIAHILGSVPVADSQAALLSLIDRDPDIDVKYGAIRSLVELASAASVELRESTRKAIEERASSISAQDRLARELRSCLLLDRDAAPSDWINFVRGCVRHLFGATDKGSERDLWRGCLNRAEDIYERVDMGPTFH